jgi:hypothetical protein
MLVRSRRTPAGSRSARERPNASSTLIAAAFSPGQSNSLALAAPYASIVPW